MLPLWDGSVDENSVFNNLGSTSAPKSSQSTISLDGTNGEKSELGTVPRKASSKRQKIFDPERVLPVVASDQPLRPARMPPKTTFWDFFGFLRFLRPVVRLVRGLTTNDLTASGRKRKEMGVDSNIPLEITLYLSSYLAWLLRAGLIQPAIATGLVNNISSLQDTLNNLERIRNTPLPFAYQAHLRLSSW